VLDAVDLGNEKGMFHGQEFALYPGCVASRRFCGQYLQTEFAMQLVGEGRSNLFKKVRFRMDA
jgi:hypothetical protein